MEARLVKIEDEIGSLKQSDLENFKQHKEMMELLRPISETYQTVGRMAKWFMALLVFLSVLGGVIIAWKAILKEVLIKRLTS